MSVEIECAVFEFLKREELARVADASRRLRATVERHFGLIDRIAQITILSRTYNYTFEQDLTITVERAKSRFVRDENLVETIKTPNWRIDAALQPFLSSYIRVDKLIMKAENDGKHYWAWAMLLMRLPHAFRRLAALEMHFYALPDHVDYLIMTNALGRFSTPTRVKISVPGAPRPLESLDSFHDYMDENLPHVQQTPAIYSRRTVLDAVWRGRYQNFIFDKHMT